VPPILRRGAAIVPVKQSFTVAPSTRSIVEVP
jgi:hypothetical protein